MSIQMTKERTLTFEIDAAELSPQQVRLIRSLNSMLVHVLTTQSEEEFFEGSSESMRMCAALIKQAAFAQDLKDKDRIPYANQAIEYSIDNLQEFLQNAKVVAYDN